MSGRSIVEQGEPTWADVTASAPREAADLYQHVFGWEYDEGPSELAYYLTALEAGKPAAGIGPLVAPDARPGWTVYFAVADVRASIGRANDLGGVVVTEATELPQQAMIAAVEAPGGSRFGLWQAFHNPGFGVRGEHGAFAWCEANVADVAAVSDYYARLFGYEVVVSPDDEARELHLGGRAVASVRPRRDGQERDTWTVYFHVHDTDAAVAAAQAGGGSVVAGPTSTRFGRVAVLTDAGGAEFGVVNP